MDREALEALDILASLTLTSLLLDGLVERVDVVNLGCGARAEGALREILTFARPLSLHRGFKLSRTRLINPLR